MWPVFFDNKKTPPHFFRGKISFEIKVYVLFMFVYPYMCKNTLLEYEDYIYFFF